MVGPLISFIVTSQVDASWALPQSICETSVPCQGPG